MTGDPNIRIENDPFLGNNIYQYNRNYYGASEASVVFRRLTEISEYGHAFERLISQQPLDRFTCDNFCSVASSLLPTGGQQSMHVDDP